MRHLQTTILWCGLLLVVVINLAPDLFYVGTYHPMGAEAVRVYQPTVYDHDFDQPVWRLDVVEGVIDTGERVQVELRNDYRDQHLLAKPNLTLLVIGFFVLLYFLAGMVMLASSARRHRRGRNPRGRALEEGQGTRRKADDKVSIAG